MASKNINRRCGQTLVLFILFLMLLIGILALTLDFGFVVLSRRTMQTAVNTAALEGARNIDQHGRIDAREVVQNVFDDDFDPIENLTTLGVGPNQSLVQRDSNDRAQLGEGTNSRELLANRQEYIYRPDPELNLANETYGDLVIGDFQIAPDSHAEMNDYQRQDFVASSDGQAFLARLRRTPERSVVANPLDRVEGTSSSGSGSPLLLGHLLPFIPNVAAGFDIRRDGITIRATAIADTRPVVYVGSTTNDRLYSAVSYGKYPDSDEIYQLVNPPNRLGETVSVGTLADELDVPTGYVAVLFEFDATVYVAGFLLHTNAADTDARKPNASPRLHDAMQTLGALTPQVRDAVLTRHRELAQQQSSILYRLPVLVRAIQ